MKYALLSVTDKTNIEKFAGELVDLGFTILSTGGTLKKIEKADVPVTSIDSYTGFPEILDGRVKTLHPKVHGGLLYKRDNPEHVDCVKKHEIKPIDLVCVNLYPFEETYKSGAEHDELIENIDIGGPSMIRSAAKNYKDVLIVTDPSDYDRVIDVLKNDKIDNNIRLELATKAFNLTAYYDSMIANYFKSMIDIELPYYTMGLKLDGQLRYGENPHQKGYCYTDPMADSYLSDFKQLHGKALSFNNLNDLNTAIELVGEFDPNEDIVCAAIKHATPCGVALGKDLFEAYTKCFKADSTSIFGGIVATNVTIDKKTAEKMSEIFLEVIAAPKFTQEALDILMEKKNVRLLEIDFNKSPLPVNMKLASGKVLLQDIDSVSKYDYKTATKREPTEAEMKDLIFGMKVVKYARSNAIVVVRDGMTLGVGGGQTSRVWALQNIFSNNPKVDFQGSVMASDAFFPFDDTVKAAANKGITAVIQPGGSIRDEDSIKACDAEDMAMVFTGIRHFRH